MLIVQSAIVSDNIADRCFACQLECCKGQCCVDGDSGAPLTPEEVDIINNILPQVRPYMTEAGRKVVDSVGPSAVDSDGDWGTSLVNGRECAFVTFTDDGTALCAIEKAYLDGKVDFQKPVSCHLYPIRIENYGEFQAVNYHEWDICHCAVVKGRETGIPLYQYLREPLIRRFGEAWYQELLDEIAKNFIH
ncbi:MAG: DUF3109 family protein [Bacteroidales bacterium]|nr:DUF3109 family protein [Bacteroidales bacterium]